MSLPPEAIDEIIDMASHRHQVPSPRGVADPSVFAASPPGDEGKRKGAGSAVECLEYAAPPTPYSAMDHFANKEAAHRAINQCAKRFLYDVLVDKAIGLMGYCHRLTVHPRDVAEALELFVKLDANDVWYRSFPRSEADSSLNLEALELGNYWVNQIGLKDVPLKEEDYEMDKDWQDDDKKAGDDKGPTNSDSAEERGKDDKMDQDWQDEDKKASVESEEKATEDDTLVYDSDSEDEYDDEAPFIDDAKYPLEDEDAPEFDAAYPPVDERMHLTDEQFREQVLVPLLEEHNTYGGFTPDGGGVRGAPGVVPMLKRAMQSFLVAKLS